jgi:hypothetical protein
MFHFIYTKKVRQAMRNKHCFVALDVMKIYLFFTAYLNITVKKAKRDAGCTTQG